MLTITGPMRSGTSIVARIAHQLGIDMGTHMRIPPPGSGLDPEYEDLWVADDLARRALGVPVGLAQLPFETYIGNRQRKARGKPWGFKSPLLVLYWSEWIEAIHAEDPFVTVLCGRPGNECLASITRAARTAEELETLLSIQQRIYQVLPDIDAQKPLEIPFGTPPEQIAAQLATLMGIESYDPEIAVRGIRT